MPKPDPSSRRQFLGLAGGVAVLGAVPIVTVRRAEAMNVVSGIAATRRLGSRLASFVALAEVLFAVVFTWLLLGQNPDAETKLHAEIDSVLGGRLPTLDDLPQLRYAEMVLAESMRLFPPAYLVGRRALAPYQVPGTDYVLPARTVVLISQYLLHRDPRFWDDPDRFDPDRWKAAADRGPRHQYAYFPFGAGPRICIGEHFAWMEGTLALAAIAQLTGMTIKK